jgi:hypothetical protein
VHPVIYPEGNVTNPGAGDLTRVSKSPRCQPESSTSTAAQGIVLTGGGRIIATLTVDLDADGRIATVHNVANPDKLHAVAEGVKRI